MTADAAFRICNAERGSTQIKNLNSKNEGKKEPIKGEDSNIPHVQPHVGAGHSLLLQILIFVL